jgi:hypothetical protein
MDWEYSSELPGTVYRFSARTTFGLLAVDVYRFSFGLRLSPLAASLSTVTVYRSNSDRGSNDTRFSGVRNVVRVFRVSKAS